MTDGATIQCQRCGFANARGDQFCGSCGAFLAWQDAPAAPGTGTTSAEPAGASGGASPVTDAPVAPAAPAEPPAEPPTWTQPPTPAAPASPSPAAPVTSASFPAAPGAPGSGPDAGDDLVRCPACGIANPATRTFCQSCGTTLAAAARVAEPTRDEIAAALASTPVQTAAVPPGGVTAGTADRPPTRGGIPRWIFAVAAAGLLVGVAVVVIGPLIAGPGPGSAATSGPTIGPSAGASMPAASGGAPGSSGAPSTSTPAVKLTLTGATASSYLGNKARYQPANAIDGDLSTSWQEGSATERGQWIEVSFAPSRADTLVIRNGFQASTALFKGNLRLKDIEVSVDGGPAIKVRLKDTTKAQRVDLGQVPGATSVRITIMSTYASVKTSVAGTPFQDAAVSEISVLGVPGG